MHYVSSNMISVVSRESLQLMAFARLHVLVQCFASYLIARFFWSRGTYLTCIQLLLISGLIAFT